MFSKCISSPIAPLTQNYFKKINRPNGEFDWSLSCLGVVLLRPRMQEYEGIDGLITSITNERAIEKTRSVLTNRSMISEEANRKNPSIYYFHVVSSNISHIQNTLSKEDLSELKPIEIFVKQQLDISNFAVYINKKFNCAFIYSGVNDIKLYHLCWAFIYNLFPSIFEGKDLTPNEISLVKSLCHKTPDVFIALTTKALAELKPVILKEELSKCFKDFRELKIRKAETIVQAKRNEVEQLLNQYMKMTEELEAAVVTYEGMKILNKDTEIEQETIDYLISNPCLHDVEYSNGCLEFNVATVLTNFDRMKWQNAARKNDIYNDYRLNETSVFVSRENRQLFLNALFDSQSPEIYVKIRGHILLQINRNYMDVERGEQFDESETEVANCITNPHFKLHGCPGQNRGQIIECLNQGDIITAIEASIAATGSVNIAETEYTFRPFVNEILNSEKRIIRRKDGVDMTPAEALLWLRSREMAA